MGKAENKVYAECELLCKLNGLIHWRNQVLNGFYRPNKKVKEYWIRQGIKGLADMAILLPNGKTLYCETKKKGGKQRESQKDFERDCIKLDVPYIVVDHWQDLSEWLDINGFLKVRI